MATIPVRGLAAKGILRDPSPYQLDIDAWSGGANMRFHANVAERAPIFRTVYDALPEEPVFCVGLEPSTGYDTVMTVGTDGRIWQYGSGSLTEVTEASHASNVDPRAYTSCFLGDVLYVNRPDQAPRYFGPTSTQFANLPNMDSAWTCRSLRVWGDYLIALNVTKPATWVDPHTSATVAGGAMPNLFKWSDLTLIGQTPGSWDPFDPTTSAGENPLEALTTPLVDGVAMRGIFVIYSENEIWSAQQSDNIDIFNFAPLFHEGGLIAPNCAVEVDGVHYCFGPKDLYRHDGVQKMSIIDKRNKDTFFRWLNKNASEVCFVQYVPALDSVFFCCNTGDPTATYQGVDRCNQAAVYDIPGDTWSFVDLPNVSAMTVANLDDVLTYASAGSGVTYATIGGTYYDQTASFAKSPVVCSGAFTGMFTNSRILAYDFMDKGTLSFSYTMECNPPAYVERIGMDLDTEGSDLATYKNVRRVFPLVNIYNAVPVSIQIGGAMVPAGSPNYQPALSFDPTTDYKVDVVTGGRYLAIRFTVDQPADFEIAGYDLDVADGGHR